MLVLYDPETLRHETIEILGSRTIPALECPERISRIVEALRDSNHPVKQCHCATDLSETHDAAYLKHLQSCHADWVSAGHISHNESVLPECFPMNFPGSENVEPSNIFAKTGFYAFDLSTGIMAHTASSALASAGLAKQAVLEVLESDHQVTPFALCRPPGHHCDTKRAGGYCYINNIVVAISHLQTATGTKDREIAILDLDFHHGNGTSSYYYSRKVRYVSIHDPAEYPYYSGHSRERGEGDGCGYNNNITIERECGPEAYLKALQEALDTIMSSSTTDLRYLFISLGFDTLNHDPLGHFKVEVADYRTIAYEIGRAARSANVQVFVFLEGGYVIDSLGACVMQFCDGFEEGHSPRLSM